MVAWTKRVIWLFIGIVALVLGGIGVVLPLLPTTPFALLAAFAFAQSSERLHQWLLDHNIFGSLIENWQRYRAISRRAKIASILAMAAILIIGVLHGLPKTVIIAQVLVLAPCALFIVSRPLPPAEK